MKKIILSLLCSSMLVATSCVDSLDDYNVSQKNAAVVPSETLFTSAVKNLTDALTSASVNSNNYRFYVQHWTATTYLDEPRYNMTSRIIPQNMWQSLYRDVLSDLKESKRLVMENTATIESVKNNQLAQIEIMEVYAWSVLLNTFGDVPYSQALDPENSLPVYDDAQTTYNAILVRLNNALSLINSTVEGYEGGDLLYKGDMEKWVKFGNSLQLKLAMVIADADPTQAKTLVEAAAPNVFTSNADNAVFQYLVAQPNNNPVSNAVTGVYSTREDYVAANTLVDVMNDLEDPRREQFFTQVNGEYVGGIYGYTNSYPDFSTVSAKVAAPDNEGLLLDYSEVSFLLAEALERGFAVGGTIEDHYNEAITASIVYWGGTSAEADAYLSQPSVAYSSAAGDWKVKIGTQKWIALYNRGYDAWLEWRRLDAPTLLPPVEGLVVPQRLIYPVNEATLNGANKNAASAAIGGDSSDTPLWWNVN
jgi:hypothetical protein